MHNRVRNLGFLSLTGMLALGLVTVVWAIGIGTSQAQEDSMHNCPQAGMWAIPVWGGADGTDAAQALDTCGTGSVAAAYSLDPQTGRWSRWFAGRPEMTTLSSLDNMQGVIALGAVAAPTPSPTPTAEATVTQTPEELACADGSTQQFRTVDAEAPWSVYCPTFLPGGYKLDDIVYGLDIAGAAPEGGVGAMQAEFVNAETGDSITFIQGLPGLSALTSGIRAGEALAEIPYGDFQAELFESAPEAPGAPFLAVLGSSNSITHWIEAIGPTEDETRQVAAGMRQVEALP